MRLYTHLSLGFPHPRFFIAPLTITAIILASFFLAACGGGDTVPAQVPTSVPATPVPPATASPVPATDVPAPTAPPAVTGSQGSGAATAESPTSAAAVPPTAAATAAPTVAPTEILASNAVRVLQRSCVEEFRQMLLLYKGPEEFGPEVVRRLSDEFTGLRPDCLEQGWDPEFPTDPEVCLRTDSLSSNLSYKKDPRSGLVYLLPTMREAADRFGEVVRLQVHFTRAPLISMVPSNLLPLRPDELVGGCWLYEGPPEGGGKWTQSLVIYRAGAIHPDVGLMDRDRRGHSLDVILRYSYPECDSLLQTVISAQLDSGLDLDASGVDDAVDQARLLAEGACDLEGSRSWLPAPVGDGVFGCPGTPVTGLQPDGSYVVNWGEHHFDGYGRSACWIRSPEGEWVGYLRE